jgi:methyltransferase (TIGR00027 family)
MMVVVESGRASRTAVFVCQGRAVAHDRFAVGRFDDPVAARLLRPDELAPVEAARSGEVPGDWRLRLEVESVRACAEVVVPRTVVIDEAVRGAGHRQVVIVGAGLDSRPWRFDALAGAVVFAVDHPATQADVRERASGLSGVAERLELVPVDLTRERLDDALARTDHDPTVPTTWVWEGVVPYLVAADVEATAAALAIRSAPGSVLAVNYQAPSLVASVGRHVAGVLARVTGHASPLANEPWRSAWSADAIAGLLGRHGFTVERDDDLLSVAEQLGSPTDHARSVRTGRVAVARRA